ncbi:MAG: hypothetical protein IJ272_05755 [Clostridia bacterium]|nr:hypothetical protein [Clostridia bacterium]
MEHTKRQYIGTTRDGYNVYDRTDSHLHFEGGITKQLVKRALSFIYANGVKFKKKVVYFREIIGYNNCVEISQNDEVEKVYRKGRAGMTPMVKRRKPEPCKSLVVIIRKDRELENSYTLVTCFVGEDSVREPWDITIRTAEEREMSERYWGTHALVYNPELIDWERTKLSESSI